MQLSVAGGGGVYGTGKTSLVQSAHSNKSFIVSADSCDCFRPGAAVESAIMTARRSIQPNFNFQRFTSEDDALEFLRRMGFLHTESRSDYTGWETRKTPKVRAHLFHDETGFVVARQARKVYEPRSAIRM